jgi:hypothetical protein
VKHPLKPMNAKVLLVGESWVSSSTHVKGFDFFSSSFYADGRRFFDLRFANALGMVGLWPGHPISGRTGALESSLIGLDTARSGRASSDGSARTMSSVLFPVRLVSRGYCPGRAELHAPPHQR